MAAETSTESTFKVCEFFSGLGGLRCGVEAACGADGVSVLDSFDISPSANNVYFHNFKDKTKQVIQPCCRDVSFADRFGARSI